MYTAPIQMQPLESRIHFSASLPRYDHIVIVMEENHSYQDTLGEGSVPSILWSVVPPPVSTMTHYVQKLARQGASLVNMQAEAHPSQPNYLALFSGSTQNVDGDTPPSGQLSAPSLGGQLIAAGLSFASYSEDLPATGSLAVKSGEYARKHNPSADFTDVPAADNLPFSAFPADYSKLPTVSMVIPNQLHDMHTGSIGAGDHWLENNIGAYAKWARKHNSLLIVTWDEGRGGTNHIPTILFGSGVLRGNLQLASNHYRLLRTIEAMYGLTPLGAAMNEAPLRRAFLASAKATTSAVHDATPPVMSMPCIFADQPITSAWERLDAVTV